MTGVVEVRGPARAGARHEARREPAARVLHVLAAYDRSEAQGRCVALLASGVEAEHVLLTGSQRSPVPGLDVIEVGTPLRSFGWRERRLLADAVARVRPDVIHFHGGPLGAMTMASGWTGGRPVVVTMYAWPTVRRDAMADPGAWRQLRRTPVLCERTVASSLVPRSVVVAALRRAGVVAVLTPDERIRRALASQAFPVVRFTGISRPGDGRRGSPRPGRFLFAGRAERTRGPDLLRRAVELLRAEGFDAQARFCLLDSPSRRALASELRGDGCHVTVGPVDLDAEMRDAVAVVLPFRYDAATLSPALVATEAMAQGVPVVGGDVECLRAAVDDGSTGLLVAPDDVPALAAALRRLVVEPGLATVLGARAHAEIERRWSDCGMVDHARWAYDVAAGPRDVDGAGDGDREVS